RASRACNSSLMASSGANACRTSSMSGRPVWNRPSCGRYPIVRSAGLMIWPLAGSSRPASILRRVVLPAPFGPHRPTLSRPESCHVTDSSRTRSPNALVTPDSCSTTHDRSRWAVSKADRPRRHDVRSSGWTERSRRPVPCIDIDARSVLMSVSVLTGGRFAPTAEARPTISEVERQNARTRGGDAPVSTAQMTASDEELVARSAGGDLDSFNQLVVRWERPIYALAYRVIGREEEAHDVVQEAFLRAYRSLGGFRGQAKCSSWLYRITLNLCRDWIRRHRRAPFVETPEGVDIVELAGETEPGESAEEIVARKDLRAYVQRARDAPSDGPRSA